MNYHRKIETYVILLFHFCVITFEEPDLCNSPRTNFIFGFTYKPGDEFCNLQPLQANDSVVP
jgi:hypothetical protein